jgi:hypothetical protein
MEGDVNMENKCLLTYEIDGLKTFEWFSDDEDLEGFVRKQMSLYGIKFKVIEAIEIQQSSKICLL